MLIHNLVSIEYPHVVHLLSKIYLFIVGPNKIILVDKDRDKYILYLTIRT